MLGIQAPALATTAAPASTASAHAAGAQGRVPYESVCAAAKPGDATCFALRRTDVKSTKGLQPAAQTPEGFGAPDLQSAYSLPDDGGAGQTVAIVDAYDDPNAEADLAVYRQQYGLPACTTDNGCFSKVDERGGHSYPAPDPDWAGEISLDLDMVSAAAPQAHIILVEADDPSFENLGTAVDEAVSLGAKFVSNSYGTDYRGGGGEDPTETTTMDAYYNHPGVAVVASTGDYSYGVAYPAASQYVTAVGGTSLVKDSGSTRGWSESAWSGAGSGCSLYEPKPAFQKDTGCDNRAIADVSAVSDPATGVSVYQTYGSSGWSLYGGTSAASPLIAAVYADAGTPVAGSYPNSYPYAADGAGINDVTTGSNGSCSPSSLCTAGPGWDGPTGLGTPHGLAAFRSGPHGQVSGTVTDSATGKALSGATVSVGDNTAHTAADGTYQLSVPVGTYDIDVSAFGYTTAHASSVAVADGDTLTKDFALDAVASRTVSGKVTDGSGHDWPLYARIDVDGMPGGPVWTDPATGAYSVSLPEGHDYTLHIASSTPGYQGATRTVTVGDDAQKADIALKADPFTSTPPGYTTKDSGTTEPFDSTDAPPAGWKVENADGTTGGWTFDDPGNRTNHTGGSGAFAVVDSDHYGGGVSQDTQLISPVYDFTGQSAPEMSFATDYTSFGGQTASVDVTTDGGATWKSEWSSTASVTGPAKVDVPLTDVAGKANVQLRFHFTGSFGWWWEVDNVFVGQRIVTPTPGGLVVGTVSDANTGDGVVGAKVASDSDSSVAVTTVATPDDPAVGDGFYSLFTPHVGAQSLTASKSHYTDLAKSVKAEADTAVSASYKLKAGKLTVTPGSVSASVGWGKQATKNLTVKNTGKAPATLKLGEQSGAFQLQALGKGAPLQTIPGDYSPLSSKAHAKAGAKAPSSPAADPSDSAWQAAPDLPQTLQDNAVGVDDGKVYSAFGFTGAGDTNALYVLDPSAGTWTQQASATDTREAPASGFLGGKFYVTGGWGASGQPDAKTEVYDPSADSWSTAAADPKPHAGIGHAVLDGKLYAIGGCGADSCGSTDALVYDPAGDAWTQIAAYPEPVSWESCAGISGKVYCAGGDTDAGEVQHAYVYDPSTDSWSPIADLPASVWGAAYTAANGQLLVSSGVSNNALTNKGYVFDPQTGAWSALPNANTAAYRSGGGLGFYKVGGATGPGTPTSVVELLPGYDQAESGDVTWLGESTQQLTLQPGASATVTVTLDASVPEITQPGTYAAGLTFGTDTPYAVPTVPVSLQVAPPKTWGKITGTVLGATAGGGSAPLAGATVQIDSWASAYTLKTAADGTYALWLDTRNNPLTVIVAKDGYQPTVATVKLTKGGTVTSNFTLKKQ